MTLTQLIIDDGIGILCLAIAILLACRKCYLNGFQAGKENAAKWQKLIHRNTRN